MTLQEAKDFIAKKYLKSSWSDWSAECAEPYGRSIPEKYMDEAAELYHQSDLTFLLGKQVRYRYVDWERGSITPWTTCTVKDIKNFDDASIDTIEFKP